jgi:signal transduction histidine kinase
MPKKDSKALAESLAKIEHLTKRETKKNQFFMAASHQLKSPLAIIQWCLQSSIESGRLDPKNKEMVLKSLYQADAMSALITDMLNVFRLVNRGTQKEKNYTHIDVNKVIDQVYTQYEMLAHKRDIHLIRGPVEMLPKIFAEETYLRQAIINLVDNAIKYSPEGSTVEVICRLAKDSFVEIMVMDEGIGIGDAEQSQLFSEFFRGEEAQSVTGDGTGLGLVLVKQIIEEFGGEVFVKSAFHKGSTFMVRIPSIEVVEMISAS